jgi:bifunctional non-homologous end joining protein LigD
VHVSSASSGKTINYVLCQDKWSLLYLVNLGCIELNPWLSRRQSLEKPDLVVIDLDPDGNAFNEVVAIAKLVRKVLTKIGAESFCKTSGSSGLHICIPTGGRYDFDVGREFAESVCRVVHGLAPRNTSVERNPAKRVGRIYLDFLQNRRGQTLAAPYCVRPRPGATVSAPLKWSEVRAGLKPADFTVHNMSKRLARVGDLWKPLREVEVDLPACRKRLSKFFHI